MYCRVREKVVLPRFSKSIRLFVFVFPVLINDSNVQEELRISSTLSTIKNLTTDAFSPGLNPRHHADLSSDYSCLCNLWEWSLTSSKVILLHIIQAQVQMSPVQGSCHVDNWSVLSPANSLKLSSPNQLCCVLLFQLYSYFAYFLQLYSIFCPILYPAVLNHLICLPSWVGPSTCDSRVCFPSIFLHHFRCSYSSDCYFWYLSSINFPSSLKNSNKISLSLHSDKKGKKQNTEKKTTTNNNNNDGKKFQTSISVLSHSSSYPFFTISPKWIKCFSSLKPPHNFFIKISSFSLCQGLFPQKTPHSETLSSSSLLFHFQPNFPPRLQPKTLTTIHPPMKSLPQVIQSGGVHFTEVVCTRQ